MVFFQNINTYNTEVLSWHLERVDQKGTGCEVVLFHVGRKSFWVPSLDFSAPACFCDPFVITCKKSHMYTSEKFVHDLLDIGAVTLLSMCTALCVFLILHRGWELVKERTESPIIWMVKARGQGGYCHLLIGPLHFLLSFWRIYLCPLGHLGASFGGQRCPLQNVLLCCSFPVWNWPLHVHSADFTLAESIWSADSFII